jgi:hypothetical protein
MKTRAKYIEKLAECNQGPLGRVVDALTETMVEHDTTMPWNFVKRWWLRRKREHLITLANEIRALGFLR